MDDQSQKALKTLLLVIIGILLLILGIIIGLLISDSFNDRFFHNESVTRQESDSINRMETKETTESMETEEMTKSLDEIEETTESAESMESEDTAESLELTESVVSEPETEPFCIVLDPGHDDTCSRNHPDLGFNEQDLNLKIALACRDELETYKGVVVYMTREDGSCPDNGIGSDDVTGRTAYAESVGADLFVSLHNNATGLGYPSAANGSEVYITVYSKFTEDSRSLGESILSELTTQVDLANRGVLTRIKPEKGYYDDGNIQDWYYLISTSVERGFPGIIIEHSYMDNAHDNALLKDEAQLRAMGIADATGIAKHYGLEKR